MKLIESGVDVPVDEVRISPYHFRRETLQDKLEALAESLREVGQIHNVSVVKAPEGGYELANGHRRLLAQQMNGAHAIRADVYEFTDEELSSEQERQKAISQFLLAANQSEPLVPLERARFYRDVMDKFGWDPNAISRFYAVPVADIMHDLRYLNISPKVFDVVSQHPDKVAKEHLDLLADYASSDKKGWRITEGEQVALVDGLIKQTNKPAAEDPREFERTIKSLKAEARQKKAQDNKARQQRQPVQVVKDVVRSLETVDHAVKTLTHVDIPKDTPLELLDKREIIDRCYALAQALTEFADGKIGSLPLKRAVATANA